MSEHKHIRKTGVLQRVTQLSRLDRIFIDHLVGTVELWYAARAYNSDANSQTSLEMKSEEKAVSEALVQSYNEVLARFPGKLNSR